MNGLWSPGLLNLLLVAPVAAQDAKPAEGIPAPTNIRGTEYPRIHDDLRVSFRIKAPEAKTFVFACFDSEGYPATKDDGGFWTATSEPQVPGFHSYRVFVDGAEVNDPSSETFYGTGKDASGIEIPEKGGDYYLPYEGVKNYHLALEKAGIKHLYHESPGTSHEWPTWRRCLREFAPLLFVDSSSTGTTGAR